MYRDVHLATCRIPKDFPNSMTNLRAQKLLEMRYISEAAPHSSANYYSVILCAEPQSPNFLSNFEILVNMSIIASFIASARGSLTTASIPEGTSKHQSRSK